MIYYFLTYCLGSWGSGAVIWINLCVFRTGFAFRCSAFGHKETLKTMKAKSRSCSLVSGCEDREEPEVDIDYDILLSYHDFNMILY